MDASTTSATALRAAHERFVTAPGTVPRVRDLVAASCWRCETNGVRLDGGRAPSRAGHLWNWPHTRAPIRWPPSCPCAVWSKERAGTNSPGAALELGRPVQIVTGEHYSAAVHAWSCAVAPVRDPTTGRVLGVVGLSCGGTVPTRPRPAPAAEGQLAMSLVAHARVLGPDGHPPCALLGPDRPAVRTPNPSEPPR
jgi:hypothetical protein